MSYTTYKKTLDDYKKKCARLKSLVKKARRCKNKKLWNGKQPSQPSTMMNMITQQHQSLNHNHVSQSNTSAHVTSVFPPQSSSVASILPHVNNNNSNVLTSSTNYYTAVVPSTHLASFPTYSADVKTTSLYGNGDDDRSMHGYIGMGNGTSSNNRVAVTLHHGSSNANENNTHSTTSHIPTVSPTTITTSTDTIEYKKQINVISESHNSECNNSKPNIISSFKSPHHASPGNVAPAQHRTHPYEERSNPTSNHSDIVYVSHQNNFEHVQSTSSSPSINRDDHDPLSQDGVTVQKQEEGAQESK